jgi:hypothetical protein
LRCRKASARPIAAMTTSEIDPWVTVIRMKPRKK